MFDDDDEDDDDDCVVCMCQTYTCEQLKSMVESVQFAADVDRESLEVSHITCLSVVLLCVQFLS